MRPIGPRLTAVLSVLCSAASGVLTNLITDEWSWTIFVALSVVVLVAVLLAWWDRSASGGSRTRVRQRARRGSTISGIGITAKNAAAVEQDANHRGRIERTEVYADNADLEQRADDSAIQDVKLRAEE